MQDVDRVAHVERFAEPSRRRGVRVEGQPICFVPCSQDSEGIIGNRGRRRHVQQWSPIRSAEPHAALRSWLDMVSLLVNSSVVSAAQKCEVGQRGGPALRPVPDVMALSEAHATARKATAAIAMVQGSA
jgi:hypothetical protein